MVEVTTEDRETVIKGTTKDLEALWRLLNVVLIFNTGKYKTIQLNDGERTVVVMKTDDIGPIDPYPLRHY